MDVLQEVLSDSNLGYAFGFGVYASVDLIAKCFLLYKIIDWGCKFLMWLIEKLFARKLTQKNKTTE